MRPITADESEQFSIKMKTELAPATAANMVKFSRHFWKAALRKNVVDANIWDGIRAGSWVNSERQAFITREMTAKIIEACPDREWRLIVALCRYAGLRCPSELNALTWDDVHWDTNRITIRAPKTGIRIIPLFPELVEPLREYYEAAEPGAVHVIAKYVGQVNLRTRFRKIIERAGLVPWERQFHNLRASRQTELEDKFPSHVVCAWLSNSESVARKHYLQVRDEHFDEAALQFPVQSRISRVAQRIKAIQKPPKTRQF